MQGPGPWRPLASYCPIPWPTRPPASWASLASSPPEDVSLQGRPSLLISTGSLSLKPSAGPSLAPSAEREALALSANRLLSPSRALFYFRIILFPANILAFPKTPGFIIFLAFPGSWEVEHKAAIIACSIQPPSLPHTPRCRRHRHRRRPPSHPLLTPPDSLRTLVTAAGDELTESILWPLPWACPPRARIFPEPCLCAWPGVSGRVF